MQLRTRIAVTFLALIAAVLAAALGVVSAANHANAQREVERQLDVGRKVFARLLDNNRRQLAEAAQAFAADYAVRQAVATQDTDTLESVLENSRDRIGASLAVLTSLDGRVLAAYGFAAPTGAAFRFPQVLRAARTPGAEPNATVVVDAGHIYQLVAVAVRSPLPVAWIVLGFELNQAVAHDLAAVTGLGVTLSIRSGDGWKPVVTSLTAPGTTAAELLTRRIDLSADTEPAVAATLSRSLAEARAPFERLTRVLFLIAFVSLVVAGSASFGLARSITRPLRALTRAVDAIRRGSYDIPVPGQRGDELGMLAEGLQVMQTAVQSRDRSIRRLAYEDTLTGVMNRTAFTAALDAQLEGGAGLVSVAVINLNRFRRINEHLGYAVGDAVLQQIAARLKAVHAPGLAVARLAADEFAAFAPLDDGLSPESLASLLLTPLADPVLVATQPLDLSATLGLARAPQDAATADELLRCAELAMRRARRDKQALSLYDDGLRPTSPDQLSLLGELRRALDAQELQLYFQPKIELGSRRVCGAEALLRWQHPTRGLLGPGQFLPFAEQTGFIRRITLWALNQALAQSAAWHAAGRPLPLAVNISADDLADPHFDIRVAEILTRHRVPAGLVTLEITESGFIEDPAQALTLLSALAALGLRLSVDDFGTGYSSLSQLARMPVQEVKIDRSFVLGLESDPGYTGVVRAAIDMGHSLGLKVVAEGIETEGAATQLRDLGCDIVQGYLYARPMPLEALEGWIAQRECTPWDTGARPAAVPSPAAAMRQVS